MSTSGHWEVTANGKQHYCLISGGYVMIGTRIISKDGFQLTDSENCPFENYSNAPLRNFIKQVSSLFSCTLSIVAVYFFDCHAEPWG